MPYLDQFVIASVATPRGEGWDLLGASWDMIPTPAVPVQTDFALLVSVLLIPAEARHEHELSIVLTAPNGAVLGSLTASVAHSTEEQLKERPEVEHVRAETALSAQGVVFPEYGRYELRILWDGEPLRDPMRLHVVTVDPVPGGGA